MAKFKLNDFRLNKKGTVGTEPIAYMKNGVPHYGTQVKLGKLGSVFLPRKNNKPFNVK